MFLAAFDILKADTKAIPVLKLNPHCPLLSLTLICRSLFSLLIFVYIKMYIGNRLVQEDSFPPRRRRTPSFSSSLLESIYRSIDNSKVEEEEFGFCRETTMIKKQSNFSIRHVSSSLGEEREMPNIGRAAMIEKWMEKKQTSKNSMHLISTSSSSESSSGGAFSSSEADSSYKERSKLPSFYQRPKPVQSDKTAQLQHRNSDKQQTPKREGGFTKTKLRALKIYGELKKVKQPISPGGRISTFLNSIFSPGNVKKVKICSVGAMEDVNLESKPKSASSFSRSCLSKTPSSRGKLNNGMKRSVRFCPVSVIVDEDCRPCGHKCIYEDDPSLMPSSNVPKIMKSASLKGEMKSFVMGKQNGAETVARDFLTSYQRKIGIGNNGDEDSSDDDEEEEDDDAGSYASSDLFELDNLIGVGRYQEELPVYETTNLKTNEAIANGFFL